MYIDQGHPVRKILSSCGISASCYYYQQTDGKRGKRVSTHTLHQDGKYVPNEELVKRIEELLQQEFVDYGYIKVTHWLRKQGYKINPKKVYRLMKEHKLLNPNMFTSRRSKQWVVDLVPQPTELFQHLEVDIKYIHVHGKQRNAMQLTVLDVMSRWAMDYKVGWSITQTNVQKMFEEIFQSYPKPRTIYVRSDNGSQFIANKVREYFEGLPDVIQEFTRPATPQQNAHIEAFHSIVEKVVCQQYRFSDLLDLESTMEKFIGFYNHQRIHSGIDYDSPLEYIQHILPDFTGGMATGRYSDNTLLGNKSEGLAEERTSASGLFA
jgi:transposase InsO family protein